MISVSNLSLNAKYSKALAGYLQCINRAENEFLRRELKDPIESVVIKNKYVKINFHDSENHFIVEIKILLMFAEKEVGYYILFEDENGITVDDILLFH